MLAVKGQTQHPCNRRFALSLLSLTLMATIVIFSRSAFAFVGMTPFGPADSSCVHGVPKGAAIDTTTGDVWLNDQKVDHFEPCTVSVPAISSNEAPSTSAGGWYEWTYATSVPIGSWNEFNGIEMKWTVPDNPSVLANDTAIEYFWVGLQNYSANFPNVTFPSGNALIQPVLQWGNNGYYAGGHYWQIVSWEVYNCNSSGANCSLGFSPAEPATQGDTIVGEMYLTYSTSSTDTWEVYTADDTNGAWTWNDMYIGSSSPKMTNLIGSNFEAHNLNTSLCTQLSPDDFAQFNVLEISEAGPSWGSFNNVSGSMSWQDRNDPNGYSPSCAWGTSSGNTGGSNNSGFSQLYWSE
jgi:hypothetical protein